MAARSSQTLVISFTYTFLLQYRAQIDVFDQAKSNSALFLMSLLNTNQVRVGFEFLLSSQHLLTHLLNLGEAVIPPCEASLWFGLVVHILRVIGDNHGKRGNSRRGLSSVLSGDGYLASWKAKI